jgi:hypothetical protein
MSSFDFSGHDRATLRFRVKVKKCPTDQRATRVARLHHCRRRSTSTAYGLSANRFSASSSFRARDFDAKNRRSNFTGCENYLRSPRSAIVAELNSPFLSLPTAIANRARGNH